MVKPQHEKTQTFASRQLWRQWLRTHHRDHPGVWLVLNKKHVGRGLSYADAVEEALCFGWIDGQLRRIDDRRHMLRFSPRRKGSVWAPSNIARMRRLIKQKRMTSAGLQVFKSAKLDRQTAPTARMPSSLTIPQDLKRAFARNPSAWEHFRHYPPSFRRTALWWVKTAKKRETRDRRIANVVANAAQHERPQY